MAFILDFKFLNYFMGNKVSYCVSCKGLVFKSAW